MSASASWSLLVCFTPVWGSALLPQTSHFSEHVSVCFLTLPWPKLTPPTPHKSALVLLAEPASPYLSNVCVPPTQIFFLYFTWPKDTHYKRKCTKRKRNCEKKVFAYCNTQPKVTLSHVYWFLCLYFNLSMTQLNFVLLKSQRFISCLWIVKAAVVNTR